MGKTNPKGALGSEERAKLLELIRSGFGIQLALAEMKTHWRRYERAVRKVRGFRGAVKRALEFQIENLVSLRYSAAIDGSERAQEFLINRNDRAKFFAAEMRRRRAEQKAKDPVKQASETIDPAVAAAMIRAGVAAAATTNEPLAPNPVAPDAHA